MKIFKKEQLKVEVLTRKQLLVVVGGGRGNFSNNRDNNKGGRY